jgi:hypothetical protein
VTTEKMTTRRRNGGVNRLKVWVLYELSSLREEFVGCGVVLNENDPRLGFIGVKL